MHPLLDDISNLSDTDLDKKITDLSKKIAICLRSGNQNAYNQLMMVYSQYKELQTTRQRQKLDQLLKDKGSSFDDIIDIN